MIRPVFLHVDLDAFFASVEQLDNPDYRGKPVIVGGLPGDRRSVVSTASYEARVYGVHSAMPVSKAYQLCPNGIYLRGRMWRYHEKSIEVMSILKNYSPDIQQMSIDEAFVDLTGTERLFGKPEETAKKMKAEIKEKTGLTISVGLASNKYLAKIASGMSKPDGLYVIPYGDEEKFMLNLPLKDLWGAGKKTQERLKSAGIFTTQELHNCSEGLLTTMFGKSFAHFLYEAVRGLPVKSFDEPVKSHSISNETTFSFDLTDRFAIETSLLNLTTEVFFRMMDEKVSGKTVSVKIRYEDFSTFTVQDSSSSYISSSDDLFERAKKLLFKKYDTSRGIRLLGVCVQNVDTQKDLQGELFDFENKKKQAVEKVVFESNKKNPSARINKARLLIKSVLFTFLCLWNFNQKQYLYSEEYSQVNETIEKSKKDDNTKDSENTIIFDIPLIDALQPEAPKALFDYTKDNTNVEFITNGSWETKIAGGLNFTNDKNGFHFDFDDFVFEQNVDLSMWFLLNKKFYVETIFQDNFDKNTFALGYYGKGILKHIRFGNNGISFPDCYSISAVGGGNIQSPGIMATLSGESWRSDFILRYDNLSIKEKNFIGKNEINERQVSVTDYESGKRFFLPDEICRKISAIYIQDKNGKIKDTKGRRLKKLSESEYMIKASENTITLSTASDADLLITFSENFSEIENICKNICTATETYFTECGIKNFSLLSLHNSEKSQLVTQIMNGAITENAIVIQCSPYFSPFWILDYYRSGTSSYNDVKLISSSSEKTLSGYSVAFTNDSMLFTQTDYIKSKVTYAKLYSDSSDKNYSEAKNRYPLSKDYPEIYINRNTDLLSDAVISFRSYTKVSNYDIGKNVLSGTVRVYINGIQNSYFSYDEKSGKVIIKSDISEIDKIKITWQEYDSASEIGSITSALGFKKDFSEKSSLGAATAVAWSFNPKKKFATIDDKSPGKYELASDYTFDTGSFKITNSLAFNIEEDDTTGILQLISFDEDIPKTTYLSSLCIYDLSENFTPKLNGKLFPNLIKTKEVSFSSAKTVKDSEISGYGAEFEFTFTEENQWCAKNIKLGSDKAKLGSASKFSLAVKNNSSAKIFIQLGVEADDDIIWENTDSIPTYQADLNPEEKGWQEIIFTITEEDRQKLTKNNDMRIIFVADEISNSNETYDCVTIGPYEIESLNCGIKTSFYTEAFTQSEKDDRVPMLKTFNSDSTNYALNLFWNKTDTNQEGNLSVYKYFSETDISLYQNLNIFLFIPEDLNTAAIKNITLSLDTNKTSTTFSNALSFSIEKEILEKLKEDGSKYHKVCLNYKEKKLFIDDKNILNSEIYVNKKILPTRFCLTINLEKNASSFYSDSSLKLDNLYLADSDIAFNIKDKLSLEYTKEEAILNIKNYPLLSDIKAKAEITGLWSFSENSFTSGTSSSLAANLLGLKFDTNIYSGNIDNEILVAKNLKLIKVNSANHKIETSSLIPFSKYINYSQFYNYNETESSSEKKDILTFHLPLEKVPANLSFSSHVDYEDNTSSQNFKFDLNISPVFKNFIYTIDAKADSSEIILNSTNNQENKNYFENYAKITQIEFSNGNIYAKARKENAEIKQIFNFTAINFQPEILLKAEKNYTDSSNESSDTKTLISFSFPFQFSKNKFYFNYSKELKNSESSELNEKYINDLSDYFSSLSDKLWFFKSLPFADLFVNSIQKELEKSSEITSAYNATYSLNWKHSLYSDGVKNFFIPSGISFITSRDISHSLYGNTSDISQHKLSFQYSALNVFGKRSRAKTFSFYEQDEFISNYSIKFKFIDNYASLDSYSISGYNMATLFIKDKDNLQNVLDFQFSKNDNWNIKDTISYKRKTSESIITNMLFKLFKKLDADKTSLYRKDILSSQFTKTEKLYSLNTYAHQLEMKFSNYVTVTAELNTNFIYQEKETMQIIPGAALSGKVSF